VGLTVSTGHHRTAPEPIAEWFLRLSRSSRS
jgi:hypothetical protein